MDDWKATMDAAQAFCDEHVIEWHELRNAVINWRVAEAPELYEGHGIGSSDGNHMIYSAVKSGELEMICATLVARGELVHEVAQGRNPKQVLAELREFMRPAVTA